MIYNKVCKKNLITIFLYALVTYVYSESDNGRFLSSSDFTSDNFYLEFEPQLRIPLRYLHGRTDTVSFLGYGGALEFGYNLDGWLFGIHAEGVWFGPVQTDVVDLKNFIHINVGLSVSKIIGKAMIPALPYWFAIAPEIGAGVSFMLSEFHQPEDYSGNILTIREFGICPYTTISAYLLFPFHSMVTSYVGYTNTLQYVSGGIVYSGAVTIGVRLYPFALEKNNKLNIK